MVDEDMVLVPLGMPGRLLKLSLRPLRVEPIDIVREGKEPSLGRRAVEVRLCNAGTSGLGVSEIGDGSESDSRRLFGIFLPLVS